VLELFQWAQVARFLSEDVFTSFRDSVNVSHRLKYYMMLKKIKETDVVMFFLVILSQ
jgi:hypothetical protein